MSESPVAAACRRVLALEQTAAWWCSKTPGAPPYTIHKFGRHGKICMFCGDERRGGAGQGRPAS